MTFTTPHCWDGTSLTPSKELMGVFFFFFLNDLLICKAYITLPASMQVPCRRRYCHTKSWKDNEHMRRSVGYRLSLTKESKSLALEEQSCHLCFKIKQYLVNSHVSQYGTQQKYCSIIIMIDPAVKSVRKT